jgi:hypothetical protein
MGDLLDDCRALLATIPILDPPKDRTSIDALHERFLRHLADAMAVSGETRVRARFAGGPTLGAALNAFETLWHGLVLLDRVGQSQCGWLREDERGVLSGRIDAVCGRADAYLESLSGWMRGGGPFPPAGGFLDPLHDASAAAGSILSRAAGKPDVPSQQLQALSMLKFALEQIESNLANISAVLEARYRS